MTASATTDPSLRRWPEPEPLLDRRRCQAALYPKPRQCLLTRPAASSARRAGGSDSTRWISGPITTVPFGHKLPKASAVAGAGAPAWKWFSESSRSGNVVHGNHPISVRCTLETSTQINSKWTQLKNPGLVSSSPFLLTRKQFLGSSATPIRRE